MVQTFFQEEARISNGWTASGGERAPMNVSSTFPRRRHVLPSGSSYSIYVSGGESDTEEKDKQVSCTTLAVLQPIF